MVCLSNLESLNAVLIGDGMEQSKRLEKLNKIAITQMKILTDDEDDDYRLTETTKETDN